MRSARIEPNVRLPRKLERPGRTAVGSASLASKIAARNQVRRNYWNGISNTSRVPRLGAFHRLFIRQLETLAHASNRVGAWRLLSRFRSRAMLNANAAPRSARVEPGRAREVIPADFKLKCPRVCKVYAADTWRPLCSSYREPRGGVQVRPNGVARIACKVAREFPMMPRSTSMFEPRPWLATPGSGRLFAPMVLDSPCIWSCAEDRGETNSPEIAYRRNNSMCFHAGRCQASDGGLASQARSDLGRALPFR